MSMDLTQLGIDALMNVGTDRAVALAAEIDRGRSRAADAETIDDFHVGDVVRNRHTLATMTVRTGEGATWLTRFYELVTCPHTEQPSS